MKRVLFAILFSLALTSHGLADPAGESRAQGGMAIAGMVMSLAISVEKFGECGEENYYACVVGASALVAAGGQGYSAQQSFENANKVSGSGGGAMIPRDPASGHETFGGDDVPDIPTRNDQIINAIHNKLKQGQSMLDQLRARGINIDDMVENPEKYLNEEQMGELQASTGSSENREISDEEAEQAVDDLLEEYGGGYGVASSIGNRGGVYVPSRRSSFNLDKFLNFKNAGLKNSAPGYFGNVRLKLLQPKSKKTLFERVSIATKRLM